MRWSRSLSTTGMVTGVLFAAASLTPSLLPRTWLLQGLLSGCAMAAGYGVGVLGRWLWSYLELPLPRERAGRWITRVAAVLCTAVGLVFLWRASHWQDSIRVLMGLEPVGTARPVAVALVALPLFTLLLLLARLLQWTFHHFSRILQGYIPRRVSNLIAVVAALVLFWTIADGMLFSATLRVVDASYRELDALIDEEAGARPVDPDKAGSAASFIDWETLGRTGRDFVASGPTARQIRAFSPGDDVREPIRVYAGLNSAEDPAGRARLALRELIRTGAFERSLLVIITPTGTGWVDPAAIDPLEYLHRGDVASVAVQYSYLPSPFALLTEEAYGAETAQALFAEVYGYWKELPREDRPRLYLHGLSLGALNSGLSFDAFDILADPFDGALWSGPPFRSKTWRFLTAGRNPGSPAWLPTFRDGSIVRFANQERDLGEDGWGPIRIGYLQYASDPVTFFDPHSLYRRPDWMSGPRGPDVTPELKWYPIVTMLQLAVDMIAGTAPVGYGHTIATTDYIDAWRSLTNPPGWTDDGIRRLKAHLGPDHDNPL